MDSPGVELFIAPGDRGQNGPQGADLGIKVSVVTDRAYLPPVVNAGHGIFTDTIIN